MTSDAEYIGIDVACLPDMNRNISLTSAGLLLITTCALAAACSSSSSSGPLGTLSDEGGAPSSGGSSSNGGSLSSGDASGGSSNGSSSGSSSGVSSGSSGSSSGPSGGSSSGSAGSSPWMGNWACTIADDVNVTKPIKTTQNSKSVAEMALSENGTAITAVLSGDAGISCSLEFADNGNNTASLNPANTQTCNLTVSSPVGMIPVTVTFVSGGTATVSGTSLKADSLPISVKDGPGGTLGVQGTGTLSADCTAM